MKYLNALNLLPGIGHKKISTLCSHFQTAENIWKSDLNSLLASGLEQGLANKIIAGRKKISPEKKWDELQKEQASLIDINNPSYPKLLKEIPSPPFSLYIKSSGDNFDFNLRPMVAVVGSRKFTQYGRQAAYSLSFDLARAGITVVSGMALGVDAIAHRGALDAGGKTIAVLGSGLSDAHIGPKTNFNLSREIMSSGSLISDLSLSTPPSVGTFPARNRIMAGMTMGTLVIESAEKSGTLITANLALDFNREVLAVPGPIFSPSSIGTNQLIQRGAKLITNVKDILEELDISDPHQNKQANKLTPENKEEEIILKILSLEPMHINLIIKTSRLDSSLACSTLSIMELKGMIRNMGGQNYILTD